MRNHYDVLGITPEATDKEVLKAYHRLARRFHPDSGSAEASVTKFRFVKESYEAVKSIKDRKAYDVRLKALKEIERFQAISRKSRQQKAFAVNGYGAPVRKYAGTYNVVDFPTKKVEEKKSLGAKLAGLVISVKDTIDTFKSELEKAAEERSKQKLREATLRSNRIPTSEIGARA